MTSAGDDIKKMLTWFIPVTNMAILSEVNLKKREWAKITKQFLPSIFNAYFQTRGHRPIGHPSIIQFLFFNCDVSV